VFCTNQKNGIINVVYFRILVNILDHLVFTESNSTLLILIIYCRLTDDERSLTNSPTEVHSPSIVFSLNSSII
jgi:hypothetical protein